MPDVPTADQIRAYLLANGWHRGDSGCAAYLMVTMGHTVRMLHEPTEYDRDKSVFDIALAERRHPADVQEAILAESAADRNVEEDFLGCARDCWPRTEPASRWVHTLVWERCAMAVEPPALPATINIPCTWIADDGYPSFGWSSVPLTLFAPWAEHLPAADQHAMLKEIADAKAGTRPGIVEAWKRTAKQLADSYQPQITVGPLNLSARALIARMTGRQPEGCIEVSAQLEDDDA